MKYSIRKKLEKCKGQGKWQYVMLDLKMSNEIRQKYPKNPFVPIFVALGDSRWQTTLFYCKEKRYMLVIKAPIRKKENVSIGKMLTVEFRLKRT